MTLVSSGEISIGGSTANRSINLELGRSATATSNLNETALRSLAGVTTPGSTISMSDFYGKSNVSYSAALNNYNAGTYNIDLYRGIYASSGSPFAIVGVTLYSDGTARYFYGDTNTATTNFTSFTWKTGGGSTGDYYGRFTVSSGTPNDSSSASDTDLLLSTTREWKCKAQAPYTNSDDYYEVIGTLIIKNPSGTTLVSKTIIMSASATSGTPP